MTLNLLNSLQPNPVPNSSAREANMKRSLPSISIRPCLLALAAVLILPAPPSYADIFTLSGVLSGGLESPPSGSPGTGNATVVLDTTANTMQVTELLHFPDSLREWTPGATR